MISPAIFLLGTIIGSFLNVVIVRLPHGGSIYDPKRSQCPTCHRTLPWWENIPIISWLLLHGRCAGCHHRISLQYPLVELSAGALFWLCYRSFPFPLSAVAALFLSLLLVATVIDLQHWIIPDEITLSGIVAGIAASILLPELMETTSRGEAALISAATAAAAYGLLWTILEVGKLLLGKKRTLFPEPLSLRLSRPERPLLHLGEDQIELEELLLRSYDHIVAHATWIEIAGQRYTNQHFYLQHQGLRIDEHVWSLEKIIPFQAEITEITVPREAMGFGDVKLLSCIGAFLGWKGMFFALFGGSILGSIAAISLLLVTRGRVGRTIPFGPALAAASVLWLFHTQMGIYSS